MATSTMILEQKYQALLQEAQRRQLANIKGIQLCFQTLSLASHIDNDCARLLAPHGLSEGRFVMLFLLDSVGEALAPNQLAERAGVTRATVTGLLDGLEREALIERLPAEHDRRALRIQLTDKGKQTAKHVFDSHSSWIASLFGSLSGTEREQLAMLLNKVSTGLIHSEKEIPQ